MADYDLCTGKYFQLEMNQKMNTSIKFILGTLILVTLGCARSFDELEEASFPTNPIVFEDAFSGGLAYSAFGGSDVTAFDVDDEVVFDGTASMKFAVPDAGAPEGAFAGGVFFDAGGRDLSAYTALTFWARASKSAVIDVIGFGDEGTDNPTLASIQGVAVNTNWKKYFIPIPDASKLTRTNGLMYVSEGPEDGQGYTFWLDEVKFENLGTISQPSPFIYDGVDESITSFIGVNLQASGLGFSANLPSGVDQRVNCEVTYFEFQSSNPAVATVDDKGSIQVVGAGQAVITATLNEIEATGSLTINSLGDFTSAPIPTRAAEDVISVFSDAYENVPVDYYNGFFNDDGQTTQGGTGPGGADLIVNGNGVINYTDLNFVAIGAFQNVSSIDASSMTHLHVDINVNEDIQGSDFINLQLINSVGNGETSGSFRISANQLQRNEWASFDIPLESFSGLGSRSEIGLIFFVSDGTIRNIFVDNLYFYSEDGMGSNEPTQAAPNPTFPSSNVISLFSDAYNDVTVDTWRTDWSDANFEDASIAGNAVKKYSALNFVGVETIANQIDATSMTHFHIDVWSADFTFFALVLVDFGADGAFGGGDDVEHRLEFSAPAQGEWISYDIPLSDFTGLTTRANMAQYIFVGEPSGASTIYVDNIFFHN